MVLGLDRRRVTGIGLFLGGLLILGFWALLSWVVPLLLLALAAILAWKWNAVAAAISVLGAGSLFWLGMALAWMAWAVGIAMLGTGILMVVWPRRNPVPDGAGPE